MGSMDRVRRLIGVLALAALLAAGSAEAHDPSAYGGLFRSRNLGATWLNADVGLFLSAALTIAVDPHDPDHLLLGTDLGLLQSRNGGRNWQRAAEDRIIGATFAVAFAPDGKSAIAAAPSGVFYLEAGEWRRASAPADAFPARAIAFAAAPGRVYLLGRRRLFSSENGGESFARVADALPPEASMTTLAILEAPREMLLAVIDGALMASADGGRSWARRLAASGNAAVDTGLPDPATAGRIWAARADRLYRSDDVGTAWQPIGADLPERGTIIRGIAADADAARLVVTTHRGMYRSADGGKSWALQEGNLPVHLESGPLVRDPTDPATLYAVYSLMPYAEVWRRAIEGSNLLARIDPMSLAGGGAFLALLVIGGAFLARALARQRAALPS
jgi:photosystem II stability/assembly factor-like uncharacterized protein